MNIKKKILITEDEKDLLSLLFENFQNAGFSVFKTEDGEQGFLIA